MLFKFLLEILDCEMVVKLCLFIIEVLDLCFLNGE